MITIFGTMRTKATMSTKKRIHVGLLHLVALVLFVVSVSAVSAFSVWASQQPTRPSRIISFIPAVTEMLFAIGAGDQVIAVGSFDRYPPAVERLPRVGALLDPNLERILSLRPDLVAVYGSQTDLRQQLERATIPIYIYSHAGLADVTETMRQLGERVGRGAEAARAAEKVEADLAEIRRRTANRPRPRTLLVFGRESGALRGIYASGGVGFLHNMLETAGGLNVLADVKRQSVQATTELILSRRPDVIIELRGTPATEDELRAMRADWDPLKSVPAVRNGRIYLLADERTVVPGPRVAEGTTLLGAALHPDVFK
jgi:iron complex transport system substrate-binding protein